MQTIHVDLSLRPDREKQEQEIAAKQGDVGRKFKIAITDCGADYIIPDNAVLSVWYSGTSGEGNYSAIGESSAFAVEGNTVTVELITQMLTNKGGGLLCLIMHTLEGEQIGVWNIPYIVEAVPGADSVPVQEYYTALSEYASKAAASADRAEIVLAEFETDASLSLAGKAADAKAVGDELSLLASSAYVDEQLAVKLTAIESNVPDCYYHVAEDNVVEWINPPMLTDVEYRTTERYMGLPVYIKHISLGAISGGAQTLTYDISNTGISRCICAVLYNQDGVPLNDYENISNFVISNKTVNVKTTGTVGIALTVMIKYTKV